MKRFTTPTIQLTVEGADLTQFSVWVTFEQRDVQVTIPQPEMEHVEDDTLIEVELSQVQTGGFRSDMPVRVQVNWLDIEAHRCATDIVSLRVGENLLREVLQ